MSKNLLIVESPSKAKTLKKYLGSDFEVLASYGHIRNLVRKDGSVDTENDFAMKFEETPRNKKYVEAIVKAAKEADTIYLATDPDREGEAISWHLQEILRGKRGLEKKPMPRVEFHEITQKAVLDAVAHPREVSLPLVEAQQARSALDYLVGFNLSPLLWRKIRTGLSAGRVQSPALRLICERENEIKAFVAQEYWTIHLDSHKAKAKITAKLTHFDGKKLEQFDIPDEKTQEKISGSLKGFDTATVENIEKKKKSRNPAAPFTTSTMQQEAVRKLSMTTDRTMKTAQQLYEGIDVGSGTTGLITYMRTDSVNLAADAVAEIRQYIHDKLGEEYLPKSANLYKTKSKNAQEAHEAIRPTSVFRTPEMVKPYLSADQFKLYRMIWQRTVACQMAAAKFDATTVDLGLGKGIFRVSGQVQTFAGFLSVYEEGKDDTEDEDSARLPELKVGETLPCDKVYGEQHFTQAPPRYSEASLVKALEEFGIGRPSTYAGIISTLKDREYVVIDQKRFIPTDTGDIVNKFLTEHFTQYVDYDFTAKMENQLDEIAQGKKQRIPVMRAFWKNFSQQVKEKAGIERAKITTEDMDESCPECGKKLQMKFGRRGKFVACTGYPECNYTRSAKLTAEEAAQNAKEEAEAVEGRECPKCGGKLVYKQGKYGKFIGCAAYPKCKHIEPLEKPKDTGVTCPECNKGTLAEKKSRYGKIFYSCNRYPECKYAVWNPPVAEPCPKCGSKILTIKTTKRRGTEKVCPVKECGYSVTIEPPVK